jgi:hypothetical protein
MLLSSPGIKNGAIRAEELLRQERTKIASVGQASDLGLFLADTHGGSNTRLQAETSAKNIAYLERHKPSILAMEFFTIKHAKHGGCWLLTSSGSLNIRENGEPPSLDDFLTELKGGKWLKEATDAANELHEFLRMEAKESDPEIIAKTVLWVGYLNSISDTCELIGIDIPEYDLGPGLGRLVTSNPIWAETIAWRVSEKKQDTGHPPRWAMIAGSQHWTCTDAKCQCDLKDLLPVRLQAYGLPNTVSLR